MWIYNVGSISSLCVVATAAVARSLPAKGWCCLMKTDEAEIKCLQTLRDSFITVKPQAIEHLGPEFSFKGPCLALAPEGDRLHPHALTHTLTLTVSRPHIQHTHALTISVFFTCTERIKTGSLSPNPLALSRSLPFFSFHCSTSSLAGPK